jgi:hypothetical protein
MKQHPTLFLVHFVATAAMTGLIWFVQVVHYPMFSDIPAEAFLTYEIEHQLRTSSVVIPFMMTEFLTGCYLALRSRPLLNGRDLMLFRGSMFLLAIVWGSTFLIQVPLHEELSQTADPYLIDSLVCSNWIRTICWSMRSLILGALMVQWLIIKE